MSERFAVWDRADVNCKACGGNGVVLTAFVAMSDGFLPMGHPCDCVVGEPRFYLPPDEHVESYGA